MKKLSLNVDELRVESFDTAGDRAPKRGTVAGHSGEPASYRILECWSQEPCSGPSQCYCLSNHTMEPPECDPSEHTYCDAIDTASPCGCV